MDTEPDRVSALEANVRRLEARIARLEGRPAEPTVAPAGPPAPPPGHAAPGTMPAGVAWRPAPATQPRAASWVEPTPLASGHGGGIGLSIRDLEERFAGRALAIVGGLALVAAAIFFLSLAFSRGWVTEPMRVAMGIAAGGSAFAVGAWRLSRDDRLLGTVLAGVGIGILEIALFAATSLYGLLPPEAGLAGALVAAGVAAVIAIRFDAKVVAGFGLVGALVAPPLVGAGATLLTIAFLAIVLVATTVIAIFRTWRWLPPVAFLLTAPQLISWILAEPAPLPAMVLPVLAAFWLLNLAAAAGEEVRVRRDDLRPSSAGLVVANAAFLLWGLLVVLDGTLEPWRGLAVLLAAGAHLLVGAWFLERQGWKHLFGALVAGAGAALVAVAALVQLDAPIAASAWAAEAVALAWLAVRRRHRWSAIAAGAMLLLAYANVAGPDLVTAFGTVPRSFPNGELVALAAVLAATGAVGGLVGIRWVRSMLVAAAVGIVWWAILFEADGAAVIALWAALLPIAIGADRLVAGWRDNHDLAADWGLVLPRSMPIWPASIAGILAWLTAAGSALSDQLNPVDWGSAVPPAIPLTDERALIAAILAATAILAGALAEGVILRCSAAVAAVIIGALVAPFEVYADLVVVTWVALAAGAVGYVRWDRAAIVPMTGLAAGLVTGAAIVAFGIVAPPTHLVVVDPVTAGQPALLPGWPLSFVALAGVLLAAPRHGPFTPWAPWLQACGGAVIVYGISIGVVAGFQRLVGGPVPLDELATQAQVALSVTWTVIGVVALGVGLATRRTLLRQGALGLLALATAKVFLVDLAAMDVAYRAVVLAGLGLLLLVGAWVVTRFAGPRQAVPEHREEIEARA
jgi:uncharacterized membrane protein